MNQRHLKRRKGIQIMAGLIGLVRPLVWIMVAAVLLGTAGFLCAIFLTILASHLLIPRGSVEVQTVFVCMVVLAVLRGILHYAEQYCNHFIAFKLLALIRHKVFAVLRKLCPAKLEGRDKGNLISIITTDIELLEVFYAHTVSPIAIAILTSLCMVAFIGHYSVPGAMLALLGYFIVGCVIPIVNGARGGDAGMTFRSEFGELNSFVLDALRGLDETIQYGQGEVQLERLDSKSKSLGNMQGTLSRLEGKQRSATNVMILLFSAAMLLMTLWMEQKGLLDREAVLTCTVAMMGSFGPVVALSNLSNNLHQTLASGERVLSLLEEKPLVEEVPGQGKSNAVNFTGASAEKITFAYEDEVILKDYSVQLEPGKITGIYGASGSGKSTLLKLLMRFWDVQKGVINVSDKQIKGIPTKELRDMESYVTQETHLFHTTIANNIAIGLPKATREEIIEAAKKASLHEFIMELPKGYETEVGELGDTLSGGEKQRIGLARVFLHNGPLMLLDEPTSNLDSLNEAVILKSLNEERKEKTIVLISHRRSTLRIADTVYHMENGRMS